MYPPTHALSSTHKKKINFHTRICQHSQMLVVRKEGKLHDQYNSFRSAFELLESVGREPRDCFDETNEDLPPLEKLKKHMLHMQQEIDGLKSGMFDMKAEGQDLKSENEVLRSKLKEIQCV